MENLVYERLSSDLKEIQKIPSETLSLKREMVSCMNSSTPEYGYLLFVTQTTERMVFISYITL